MNETPENRSRIMRAVKGRDTSLEMIIRRLIYSMGYRYRLHRRELHGKPDLVFSSRHKVIFIHGCFWHGHDCKRGARIPKTNRDYWENKIARNQARDAKNKATLQGLGWEVLIIWECQIKDEVALKQRLSEFLDALKR
ncbi:MAG: very short patch repair endonuclease [Desulfobaccales bacterium]